MRGPSGHWSSVEDAALHELPWAVQLLYLRGLRRWMDGSDGVVGLQRRISYRSMIELLTVPEQRGRHSKHKSAPTESSVRQALRTLRDCGLIEVMKGYEHTLVFKLPLALQDQSVSRMSDGMSDGMSDPAKPHGNAGLRGMSNAMSDGMSDTPQKEQEQEQEQEQEHSSRAHRSTQRAHATTLVGELCKRLRQQAHMIDAAPHRPELLALLSDGIEVDDIVDTAVELSTQRERGPPRVGYLVATIRGRLRDAAQSELKGISNGNALSFKGRPSVCDRIEQQDKRAFEREAGPGLRLVQ